MEVLESGCTATTFFGAETGWGRARVPTRAVEKRRNSGRMYIIDEADGWRGRV